MAFDRKIRCLSIAILLSACLLCSPGASAMCGGGLFSYYQNPDGWYYGSARINDADPASFHVLAGTGSDIAYNPCARDSGYAADKFHVYRGTVTLPLAEPATFSFLAGGYSRDARHVYYLEKLIDAADPGSFRAVDSGFFKDSRHVYLHGTVVPDADPVTFAALGNHPYQTFGLAHDATHVFFGESTITNANPKDLKSLGGQYWRSNKTTFFAGTPLAQVDSATFRVPPDDELAFSAEDRERYFLGETALPKAECKKVGEAVLACRGFILAIGRKYTEIDSSSLHYLGRFPRMCQVIEGSMIYQDNHAMYEFYGDGTIMKFLNYQPERRFERLDKPLEDRLCIHPVTQSLRLGP